ncbi:class I SAM-dependent methyltransferase [Thermodesulfobacteriota bacterium]
MNYEEIEKVEKMSNWYMHDQLDFDKKLINFRYLTIKPFLKGPVGIELGPAEGIMTLLLINNFEFLTVVDASSRLLAQIPEMPNLVKIHSLFEEFETNQKFNTIIMEHILEHIEDPAKLLVKAKSWLAPDGNIVIGVPNGHSIHRLAAVKMELLNNPCELNERDISLGHRRVYTPNSLKKDIIAADLEIKKMGGVFFKPLSNQQIQEHWTEEMIDGFYELGKDFPEYAAEIFAVCQLNPQ